MMSDVVKHRTDAVNNALGKIVKAHQAVKEGIATHAEKHQQALDQRRENARHVEAINVGIANQSKAIQGNT